MTLQTRKGSRPHIEWIDLQGRGVYTECAVMKRDDFDNIYFIELPSLDTIDKTRLARILTHRNAPINELWDLMSQITLNNGVNALHYFHQLVKIITTEGVVMNPRQGQVGMGRVDTKTEDIAAAAPSVTEVALRKQLEALAEQVANLTIASNKKASKAE